MIRRIHRTLVLEYVTDRPDDELPVFNPAAFGGPTVISDELSVVDAAVDEKVAQVEALVSQGVSTKRATAMVDRQIAAAIADAGIELEDVKL